MSIFPHPLLLVFFSFLLCPVASQTGHYGPKEVKSGHCSSAELIGTIADCKAAGMVLGLGGTVETGSESGWPPGCIWYNYQGGYLYFNTNKASTENLETVVARVRLINLTKERLNGQLGTRTKWNKNKGRFTVILDDGQRKNIKSINLEIVQRSSCLCERCESWKLDQCADCKKDLGLVRLAEEERQAKLAMEEDRIQAKRQPHAERIRNLGITVEALIVVLKETKQRNIATGNLSKKVRFSVA